MQINCQSCGKSSEFLLPLWVRTTFKFNEDGTLSILHVKPLESLEDKLTDNNSVRELSCKECGSNEVDIVFNEYETDNGSSRIGGIMSYRDQITERIKDAVNRHIETLKSSRPDLHLTKQWRVVFDNGFAQGHATLPVVTHSKKGKHLVAEVEFIVPHDLEIDLDELELSLRDEPYKKKTKLEPPALDQPLGVLNDIIVGVNNFLSELTFSVKPLQSIGPVPQGNPKQSPSCQMPNSLKVNGGLYNQQDISEVRDQIRSSNMLPEWLRSISNRDVYNTLIEKIAKGYVQYAKTRNITLQEFFKLYEDYLRREGKLYDYCKYKAQPVDLDDNGYCQEGYCSKKSYHKRCEHSILQFGKK